MGKVKAVTNANVADFVAERKALGSEIKTEDQAKQEAAKVAAEGIKPAPEQAPLALESKPTESDKKPKNSVQERIDELTKQRKELEEFSEQEYEARLQAQRRIAELESQLQSVQSPPKKENPQPDPSDKAYLKEDGTVDQKKFLEDWGKWNREKAIEDFKAKEEQDRKEADKQAFIAESESRRLRSIEAARKEYPDYDEKVLEAKESVDMKRRASPNADVIAMLSLSEYQGHILYHFIQHPEDVDKFNKMRPGQIGIAIGRLETQFAKPGTAETQQTTTDLAPKPKLPEPMTSLGAGSGNVPMDITQPMDFKAYKQRRLDEIRKRRKG